MPEKLSAVVSFAFWALPCFFCGKAALYGLGICQAEIGAAKANGDRIGVGMLLVVGGAALALICWSQMHHHLTDLLAPRAPSEPPQHPVWGD